VFQHSDLRLDIVKAQIEQWVETDLTAEELADAATLAQRTVRLAAGPAS
jgi:transcriptional regulator GlxA family with amidase domain